HLLAVAGTYPCAGLDREDIISLATIIVSRLMVRPQLNHLTERFQRLPEVADLILGISEHIHYIGVPGFSRQGFLQMVSCRFEVPVYQRFLTQSHVGIAWRCFASLRMCRQYSNG